MEFLTIQRILTIAMRSRLIHYYEPLFYFQYFNELYLEQMTKSERKLRLLLARKNKKKVIIRV